MKKKPEIQYLDIVLLGDFNPVIFSPAWFSAHGLIGEIEAESAEVQLIHPDIALFSLPWCRVQVTRERCSLLTEQEAYFQILHDLVVGTFQLLSHTPLRALGLNRGMHIKFDSDEQWHEFGHFLAPQNPWVDVFEDSGMLKLEMVPKFPPADMSEGTLRIKVEPSNRIQPGILVNVNKHFEIQKKIDKGGKAVIEILRDKWIETNLQADQAVATILENFEKRNKHE